MERRLFLSDIYDFYSALLTERQRELFEMYYLNDLSLSEIAEQTGVSRPAVWDLLKRTEKNLCDYEEKLNLLSRHKLTVSKFEETKCFLDKLIGDRGITVSDAEKILSGMSVLVWGE